MVYGLARFVYDLETKEVGEGKKVLNNRVAFSIDEKNTTFIDVVAWNGIAETLVANCKKGYEIFIENAILLTKKKVKDEVEYETHYLLIKKFKFTHGNKRNNDILDDIPYEDDVNFI